MGLVSRWYASRKRQSEVPYRLQRQVLSLMSHIIHMPHVTCHMPLIYITQTTTRQVLSLMSHGTHMSRQSEHMHQTCEMPWDPPAPMNHAKYLRAGPAEMPFQNWYTANTNHFHLTDSVRWKSKTQLGWVINPVPHNLVRRIRFWRIKISGIWFYICVMDNK